MQMSRLARLMQAAVEGLSYDAALVCAGVAVEHLPPALCQDATTRVVITAPVRPTPALSWNDLCHTCGAGLVAWRGGPCPHCGGHATRADQDAAYRRMLDAGSYCPACKLTPCGCKAIDAAWDAFQVLCAKAPTRDMREPDCPSWPTCSCEMPADCPRS